MESSKQKSCGCFWLFSKKEKKKKCDKSTSIDFDHVEQRSEYSNGSLRLENHLIKSSSLSSTQKFLAPLGRKPTIYTPSSFLYFTTNHEQRKNILYPLDTSNYNKTSSIHIPRNNSLPSIQLKDTLHLTFKNLIVNELENSERIDINNKSSMVDDFFSNQIQKKIELNSYNNEKNESKIENYLIKENENEEDNKRKQSGLNNNSREEEEEEIQKEFENKEEEEEEEAENNGKARIGKKNIEFKIRVREKDEFGLQDYLISSPNATIIPNENPSIKDTNSRLFNDSIQKFDDFQHHSNKIQAIQEFPNQLIPIKKKTLMEDFNNVINIEEKRPDLFIKVPISDYIKGTLDKKKLPPLKPVTPHYFNRKRSVTYNKITNL